MAEGAQIFNFDQILEAKCGTSIAVQDDAAVTINLIGDSLKEPFWPQGTGVNRGILGVFDAVYMLCQAAGKDLTEDRVRQALVAERELLQTQCFRADTPYEKDGIMVRFQAKAVRGSSVKQGSFTLDPKTRYQAVKHGLRQRSSTA